jgi:hypothetical protein
MPDLNSANATYNEIAEQFGSVMYMKDRAKRRVSDSSAPSVESGPLRDPDHLRVKMFKAMSEARRAARLRNEEEENAKPRRSARLGKGHVKYSC